MSGDIPLGGGPGHAAPRFHVAIVGGGPAGFYAAEALLRSGYPVAVDLFERLPTPYGLVRFGVAPDHPKLKQVTAVFDRIAQMPGFRFVGGIEIGVDVTVEALRDVYHAVILATGAAMDRPMAIPGETLAGVHSAGNFVGWYNGHPDHRDLRFDVSGETAVVIGHGNVALDVARILLKTTDELRHTDIAAHALEALSESRIRTVHVVGRRGPAETRFSAKELAEFGDTSTCAAMLDPTDVGSDDITGPEGAGTELRAALATLNTFARRPAPGARRCVFRFHLAPLELRGEARVESVRFRRTNPSSNEAIAAAPEIGCNLVFSSIGRRSAPISGVPYDAANGVHANAGGRVVQNGSAVSGLYVCGWSKRGPQGTIGTNRACSVETVEHLLGDLARFGASPRGNADDLMAHLMARTGRIIDYAAWKRIDAAEAARGRRVGKPREKFVTLDQMQSAAQAEAVAC